MGSSGAAVRRNLNRDVGGSSRPARARDSQSVLLAGIADGYRFGHRAGFGTLDPPGDEGIHWIEPAPGGPISRRRRCYFSGDALLDARAREFADRLLRCYERDSIPTGLHLVAGRLRAGDRLLRLHLATLLGKGQRQTGQSGVLLIQDWSRLSMNSPTTKAILLGLMLHPL